MSAQFNDLLQDYLPESHVRHQPSLDFMTRSYGSQYGHEFTGLSTDLGLIAGSSAAPATTDSIQSPTLASRLAGEPAYCSGRHCCQWTLDGYVCNNHYPSAEDLDKHVAVAHAGKLSNGRPSGYCHCHWAGCNKCESFGSKPKLIRHIHSHTGHKPHQCPYPGCGKGFVTKEQLKNHETTHTRTKEHICPECGKGFAVKTALTSHLNMHKGTKPYICEECGKGFADSSNLSKHKAIHKRMAAKKHRHAAHRYSVSTDTPPLLSPSPFVPTHSAGHFPCYDAANESIESPLKVPRGRPCYDVQCSDQNRVPCRSVPPCRSVSPCRSVLCNDRNCSPETFEPCTLEPCEPCDPCDPCAIPDCIPCEPCDMLDCGLDDCMHDCIDFCGAENHDDFCTSDDEECRTPPPPLTRCSVPMSTPAVPSLQTMSRQNVLPPDGSRNPRRGESVSPRGPMEIDEDGLKQLRDFIRVGFGNDPDGEVGLAQMT